MKPWMAISVHKHYLLGKGSQVITWKFWFGIEVLLEGPRMLNWLMTQEAMSQFHPVEVSVSNPSRILPIDGRFPVVYNDEHCPNPKWQRKHT